MNREVKKHSVTILGSGTSTGVPILGCNCEICQSKSVKNKRSRSSIVVEFSSGKKILVDTTPDMRTQLLTQEINHIDAAIITHIHADHVNGIDDLRAFCFKRDTDFPIYTHEQCHEDLKNRFPYIFDKDNFFGKKKILGGGIPHLKANIVGVNQVANIEGEDFYFFLSPHGHIKTLSFITHKMAYLVDLQRIDKEILEKLKSLNLDLLILDCVAIKPHQTHLHLDLALKYAREIQAKSTRLTHLSHRFDHDDLSQKLTKTETLDILPTFDGEILNF
jgi:phosphoribosyl 1,2-cyclic phosphate phosphodiesterase